MAVREHQAVALGPIGLFGLVVQCVEEEDGEDVRHVQGPRCVTGARLYKRLNNRDPDVVGLALKLFYALVSEFHISLK